MTLPDRIIRFIAKEDGKTYYGSPVQSTEDLGLLHHTRSPITAHTLTASPLSPTCSITSTLLTVSKLLAPLSRDEIKTIRGTGAQYPGQNNGNRPDFPPLFQKPLATLGGPGDAVILPAAAKDMENEYEVELCVVIGPRDAKNVSVQEALDYVLGYTVSNDVTARAVTEKVVLAGKAFDTYLPIGPVLVSTAIIRDPQAVQLRCWVNGVLMQDLNTSAMLTPVAELISKMSQGVTLEAGSIITTGSPLPLAKRLGPKPYLAHGDEVRCYVEGIGTLINPVIDETFVSRPQTKL